MSYTPAHLADRIRAVTVTDGERKTITVLFADLKGSTALIEGLDPEEARSIIDPALQLMMDAVHRYEGYVAQALGDGIFALFGAPIAHEDHPQRALFAALLARLQQPELRGRVLTIQGLLEPQARLFLVTAVKEAPSATPPPGEMMKLYHYPSVCCFEFRGSFRYARAILTEAIVSLNY